MKKVLVFGAGPLGSLMASRLVEAGHDVSLLARGQRLEDLRECGIIIEEEGSGIKTITQINVVETFEPDDDYDLVMIVMRKNLVSNILPTLSANKKVSTFLFLMNNAAGPKEFTDALGKNRVMVGFPMPGGERIGNTIRIVPVDENHIYEVPIGEAYGPANKRTQDIAALLESMRGYKIQIREDIDTWLKYHVALLMPAFVPAMLAADVKMKRMGRTRDLLILTFRGIKEALNALKTSGYPITPKSLKILFWIPEPIVIFLLRRIMVKEKAKASVEGHIGGGLDELKHLTNEIMPIIRKSGAPTPSIDRLLPYYEENAPLFPEGSRKIPMNWESIRAILLIVAILIYVLCLSL